MSAAGREAARLRCAWPGTDVDGALGMHAIENRSNASIWYHQLGAEDARATLAPEESDERLIEDASPLRARARRSRRCRRWANRYRWTPRESLRAPSSRRTARCLRITVAKEPDLCRVVVEDATSAGRRGKVDFAVLRNFAARDAQKTHPPLDVSVKLARIGASVVHGDEELLYGRVRGLVVKALAR